MTFANIFFIYVGFSVTARMINAFYRRKLSADYHAGYRAGVREAARLNKRRG